MTNQAELQAMLDDIAGKTSEVVFLPMGGDADALRRAICHQVKPTGQDLTALYAAVDEAAVLAVLMRLTDKKPEWT